MESLKNFDVENALMQVNFSRFSKVKGNLLNRLLNQSREVRPMIFGVSAMNEAELDMVAAAGANPGATKKTPLPQNDGVIK